MLRFTLRQLEYLITCVDTGSLVAAADALNVSQPSVSAAIAKLEAQLGVQLLIRLHAQGVVPTATAQPHIQQARNLLEHAREFQRSADASQIDISGELRLGSFTSLAPTYLPGLIAELGVTYPDIALKISEGTQDQLIDGLRLGDQQVALVYDHELPDDMYQTALFEARPHVVLPANHPLARMKKISLKHIVEEPLVLLDISPSRHYFTSLFTSVGLEPRIAYRTSSLELLRGLVGRGLGYSILVTRPPGDLTYDGQVLAVRPLSDNVERSRIVLCHLNSTRPTQMLKAFNKFAVEYFDTLRTKKT